MPQLTPEFGMWFALGGVLALVVAAVLVATWTFGREASPRYRPAFLATGWRHVILAGWLLLLLIGGGLALLSNALLGIIAIAVYWLLLPISVGPRVRRRLLPPWEELRAELEGLGYNQHNYWRRGDWWKDESRRRPGGKDRSDRAGRQ